MIALDYDPDEIKDIFYKLNFNNLLEIPWSYISNEPSDIWEWIKYINTIDSNYTDGGLNSGEKFKSWLQDIISAKNINTDITFSELYKEKNHDLNIYGSRFFDPKVCLFNSALSDDFKVVDAVRISMSIPFFFKAVELPGDKSDYYVDGGMFNNYPITFNDNDKIDESTVGFSLNFKKNKNIKPDDNASTLEKIKIQAITLFDDFYEQDIIRYKSNPEINNRTVYIDTSTTGMLDFDMSNEEKDILIKNGHEATIEFIKNRINVDSQGSNGMGAPGAIG